MAEKYRYFLTSNIVLIQLAVQLTMEALGADGDTGDDGDAVMTIPMMQNRGLPHWTPRFRNRGNQEEARFVDKDEVGRQPCGVFFTRGKTERFHFAISSSSRSMARRFGFW